MAARDIAVGEVVVVDRAAVESILMSACATHCAECAEETVAPVPCRNCAGVVFCSEECRQDTRRALLYPPTVTKNLLSIGCLIIRYSFFQMLLHSPAYNFSWTNFS